METPINKLLASDHAELDELLTRVFLAFDAADAQLAYQHLDMFWARLATHIRAEHLHLFPAILDAMQSRRNTDGVPSLEIVREKLAKLKEDHNFFMRKLILAIKHLRGLQPNNRTNELPSLSTAHEVVVEVSRHLETHNQMEESEVYLWADRLLNSMGRADLGERVQKELGSIPPRFRHGGDKTRQD